MVSAWKDFKNIFHRPLFIIIFRPEMLKFHPYSILTGDTRVEFVIYCVLIWFYFPFQKFDITICFWYLHLRQMSWSEFAKFCLFVCFESWKFNVNLKIHFKHGPWELNSHFKMYPPENSSSFNQKKQISTFTTKRSKTLVGTFKTKVELVREFYFSKIICLVKTSDFYQWNLYF